MKLINRFCILLAMIITAAVSGCSKNGDTTDLLEDGVTLKLAGIEEYSDGLGKLASVNAIEEQIIQIPFEKDLSILATLTPVSKISLASQHKMAADPTIKDLVSKTTSFNDGTKFLVLVYDKDNKYITQQVYTYSTPSNGKKGSDEIKFSNLEINKTYTFIIYTNNTSVLPTLSDTDYNKATLKGLTDDTQLLYYKSEPFEVKQGKNFLNVKMKHVFSEVSTEIVIDQVGYTLVGENSYNHQGSVLTAITNPIISPAFSQVDFKLSDASFSSKTSYATGKVITVPTIVASGVGQNNQVYTIPSQRIIVENGTATFEIPSIRINNTTNPVKLTGFNMKPGVRYKLKLQIGCPCTQVVGSTEFGQEPFSVKWHTEKQTTNFNFAGSDFGATIDIFRLDNSFNMTINDTYPIMKGMMAKKHSPTESEKTVYNEIQFQGFGQWPDASYPPNIEFEDGSRWGKDESKVPEIFNMNDKIEYNSTKRVYEIITRDDSNKGAITKTESTVKGFEPLPIIKIIITKEGTVKMLGSKNLNGGEPYFPLRLINGNIITDRNYAESKEKIPSDNYRYVEGIFQKVKWNTSGTNKVTFSQQPMNKTFVEGKVTGQKIKSCSEVFKK